MTKTTTCERCGAKSDGLLTIVLRTGWQTPSREYGCGECLMTKRDWATGELRNHSTMPVSYKFEFHRCERCEARMLREKERYGKTLLADRFCRDCIEVAPKVLAAKRTRLSRQARRAAAGTPSWTCSTCKAEITGRVYASGWGNWRRCRCEDCERTQQVKMNLDSWEASVANGTPGHVKGFLRDYVIPNPDDFVPNLETHTCEVCAREVDFAREMTERRTVVWCGEDACFAGAVKLAKRVEPVGTRPCERCGEMHSRKRGARYCSDICRALASRERRVAESGG